MQFLNGADDDQVDAMTQALLWFIQPREEVTVVRLPWVQISPI